MDKENVVHIHVGFLLRKIVIYDNTDEIGKRITVPCTIRKTQRHFLVSVGRGWSGGYQMVGAGKAGVMVNDTKP